MAFSKINPIALGLSIGILSGIVTFFASLAAFIVYAGKPIVSTLGTMYIAYNPTLANCAIGTVIVFVNSFIGCYIAARLYNGLLSHV